MGVLDGWLDGTSGSRTARSGHPRDGRRARCEAQRRREGAFTLLYKDHNNRIPPLTFRTYQILPHTNSYFHCLYSYLDLLPQGALGHPQGGQSPPGTLGATGEGLDNCKDSESSY